VIVWAEEGGKAIVRMEIAKMLERKGTIADCGTFVSWLDEGYREERNWWWDFPVVMKR
jgi:hypothetical protein